MKQNTQEEKLTLCQTQEEWERFNQQYKQGYYPTNLVTITTSGNSYQTIENYDTKAIEIDI